MAIPFDTHPDRYKHWKLSVDGAIARLSMDVALRGGLKEDYELKLNSYDLSVDIELSDAIERLRFEHPEVGCVIITSELDRVFCAGANIPMLSGSKHAFKVNFCKYTNETRLGLEDASAHRGLKSLAALNGTCAGGGYELALACDEIVLIDDGASAVSLPEVPLLGVLPGTGGLTRLVDKRMVRRDHADVFCTTSEGIRGKRAVEWKLVDAIAPRSKFDDVVSERAAALAAGHDHQGPGIALPPVTCTQEDGTYTFEYVTLKIDSESRTSELTVHAPKSAPETSVEAIHAAGAEQWAIRCWREIERAILIVRFEYSDVGLIVLKTAGDAEHVKAVDAALEANKSDWLVSEILRLQARVMKKVDVTSRSIFSLIEEGSCFVGSLLELALAGDRTYMLEDDDEKVSIELSEANRGGMKMANGLSRLETHFLGNDTGLAKVLETSGAITTPDAADLGIITWAADDIDWEDDVRIAIEERASMSPDALTGMEASLRFAGPETMESKIFARLSAWQNWIFQRPNAVGPDGALTKYGHPERAKFNWGRC